MTLHPRTPPALPKSVARRIWLRAQRLETRTPFGDGADAARAALEHLGYVQIDTINVIERCHHHILWTRIPNYRRQQLHRAQTTDRSVFEYWTHALSYVPSRDISFFLPAMRRHRLEPKQWFSSVTREELRKVLGLIRRDGALSIRDIDDDVLVEKDHAWASRKPSMRALQLAFYSGLLTVSERTGMLKTYELTERHFGWEQKPRPATERQVTQYKLDRALRSQGLVNLDSVCHLDAPGKDAVRKLIEARVRGGSLAAVTIDGAAKSQYWIEPAMLEAPPEPTEEVIHILSPFDPLIIQRRRLELFFDYAHRFEAYVPKEKRVLGYFALPVLVGDEIVAAIDLKTDRGNKALIVQKWTWIGKGKSAERKRKIEQELHRFERFQLEA
jgi:uncharacterized protein YcaQ